MNTDDLHVLLLWWLWICHTPNFHHDYDYNPSFVRADVLPVTALDTFKFSRFITCELYILIGFVQSFHVENFFEGELIDITSMAGLGLKRGQGRIHWCSRWDVGWMLIWRYVTELSTPYTSCYHPAKRYLIKQTPAKTIQILSWWLLLEKVPSEGS